jgi:autotransporter-associated beta strand protein
VLGLIVELSNFIDLWFISSNNIVETTGRTLNFPGHQDAISLDQSGTGLFKLTSPFVISGYAENKTIVLTGSGSGTGEIACNIENPYDRKEKATTSLTKNGTGTWLLSGKNSYTGPTTIKQGTLVISNPHGLGEQAEVSISQGGIMELMDKAEIRIRKLELDGKPQPPGTYDANNSPNFIKGKGVLKL